MFQVIAGTAGVRGPRPGSPAGVLDPPAMSAKRENRLNDTTLEKLRACNALPARRPQSQQKVASNCHGSPSFKDSSLTTSYKVLASWREVWRAVGTARTRTVIRVWWRRMEISSPTLIAWDDFAIFPLIETRCASQSFWASVRRAASRLALRKRSRRIQRMKAVPSAACSCLLVLGFWKDSEQLALFLLFAGLLAATGNTCGLFWRHL